MKWQFNKFLILEGEQRQKKLALKWVIAASILVSIVKLTAYIYTQSDAILSDFLESLINLAASLFALFGIYYSGRPRDSKHPFGHGKMEFLTASIEGVFVCIAGAAICGKAVYNLYFPQEMGHIDIGMSLVALGALANFGLSRFLWHKSKRLNSVVLAADSKRIISDSYSSIGLVAGLAAIYFTKVQSIDSALAILAGMLIIKTGYKLVKQSLKGLLDAANSGMQEELLSLFQKNSQPGWIDIKNIRVNDHRMYLYIDCEMVVPRYWQLQEVYEQTKEIERIINQHFKERVELFVQSEPCRPKHCPICRMQNCPVRQFPYMKQKPGELPPASSSDWAVA